MNASSSSNFYSTSSKNHDRPWELVQFRGISQLEENLPTQGILVLMLYRVGCPWCERLIPYLLRQQRRHPETKFAALLVEGNSEVDDFLDQYDIQVFPSVLIIEGNSVLETLQGTNQVKERLPEILET